MCDVSTIADLTGWELAAELAEVAEELAELAITAGLDPTSGRGRLGQLARRNRDLVFRLVEDLEVAPVVATTGRGRRRR